MDAMARLICTWFSTIWPSSNPVVFKNRGILKLPNGVRKNRGIGEVPNGVRKNRGIGEVPSQPVGFGNCQISHHFLQSMETLIGV